MSAPRFLAPLLNRRRDPAPTHRAFLDRDSGELLMPSVYPYPPGRRPIAPFVRRIIDPRGPRPDAHLFPPGIGIARRTFAHIDYTARRAAARSAARDGSGIRTTAKGSRTRPWLFAGLSSATPAASSAAGPAPAGQAGGCEDCG